MKRGRQIFNECLYWDGCCPTVLTDVRIPGGHPIQIGSDERSKRERKQASKRRFLLVLRSLNSAI